MRDRATVPCPYRVAGVYLSPERQAQISASREGVAVLRSWDVWGVSQIDLRKKDMNRSRNADFRARFQSRSVRARDSGRLQGVDLMQTEVVERQREDAKKRKSCRQKGESWGTEIEKMELVN